jgi:regulator of replication initiation timing
MDALEQETKNLKQIISNFEVELKTKNETIQNLKKEISKTEQDLISSKLEFQNFKDSPVSQEIVEKLKRVTESKEKSEQKISELKSENERLINNHQHQFLLKCCEAEGLARRTKILNQQLQEEKKALNSKTKENQTPLENKELLLLNAKISELEKKIKESIRRNIELESEMNILTENIKTQNSNYQTEMSKQRQHYEKEIQELSTKLSVISKSNEGKTQVMNEVTHLNKTIEQLNSQILTLKTKETGLETVNKSFQELKLEFTKIGKEKETLKKENETLVKQLKEKEITIYDLNQQLKLKTEQEVKNLGETKILNEKLSKMETQLTTQIADLQVENQKIKQENETLQQEINKLQSSLGNGNHEKSSKKRKIRDEDIIAGDMKAKKAKSEGIVVIFSGFNAKQEKYTIPLKEELTKFVIQMNGKVTENEEDPTITHVVAPPTVRTYKTLCAALKHKWVISPEWIVESQKVSEFKDENDYVKHKYNSNTPQGFKRIENLFKGHKFFFTQNFEKSKSQFFKYAQKLIKEDGHGKIVDKISDATVILMDTKETISDVGKETICYSWEKFINWIIPKKD